MLTCVKCTGSVVVSQVFLSCPWFSLVAGTGGSLGHGGGDVRLGQLQPDAGWGAMSDIV